MLVCDIVNAYSDLSIYDDRRVTSVVNGGDGFVLLLAGRIPHLEADTLAGPIVVELRQEGSAQSRLAELVKLIVNETDEQAAFADSRIPQHYHLHLLLSLHPKLFIITNHRYNRFLNLPFQLNQLTGHSILLYIRNWICQSPL